MEICAEFCSAVVFCTNRRTDRLKELTEPAESETAAQTTYKTKRDRRSRRRVTIMMTQIGYVLRMCFCSWGFNVYSPHILGCFSFFFFSFFLVTKR